MMVESLSVLGATILCVEDEVDLLRDIADELEEAKYHVIEVNHGKQAFELIQCQRPDLILCDISMPVMDGFELLEKVQSLGADYADIPFVFLTALSDPREVIKGKRLGADDYLVKPIDYDLLLATVEARLRQVKRIRNTYRVTEAVLVERYGLTPTEARVAVALSNGKQAVEIAAELEVARSTVTYHLRNIFSKTGVSRQAELVALLLGGA